jgi:L-ascorbate metabolism protein UlaG (beta-lactamase superfamily)
MATLTRTFGCLGTLVILMIIAACVAGQAPPASDPGLSARAGRQEPLVLTYIANEGVMVSSGDSKVLIDALFDKPVDEYRAPSPEILDKILKGEAPFDGVDLLLVTHNHPDHFDAPLAARYLAKFPECVLVAPADAVAEMCKAAAEWPKIKPHVVSIDLKVGEKEKRDLSGISLTAFRTLHSGDRESPMNLMVQFELGDWRVFHEGDSTVKTDECQNFGLGSAPIDLALVHFWFPLEPNAARLLQEVLKPDHIALMHLPVRLEGDAPGKIDQVRKYYKDIFLMLPGMPARVFQKQNPGEHAFLGPNPFGDRVLLRSDAGEQTVLNAPRRGSCGR